MNRIIRTFQVGIIAALMAGCASVERTAYVTTGGLTTAVELARQAYVQHENTCKCVTQSEHDKVMNYYAQYQQAAQMAQVVITAYKAATVPNQAALTQALSEETTAANNVLVLVESLLPASETTTLKTKLPKVKGVK